MASSGDMGSDAREQIRQLREQVDSLMRDRVGPRVQDTAARAQQTFRQAREVAEEQTEALTDRIRDMPILAVLIAAGAGYLIGRLTR
jgi:ElaB/YqjD/DUF883 family membrane-anchored ribosome-binding protein